jgi:hypothetical protein
MVREELGEELGSDSNQSQDAINTGAARAGIYWLVATFFMVQITSF